MSAKQQAQRWLMYILLLAVAGFAGFYLQQTLNKPSASAGLTTQLSQVEPQHVGFSLPDVNGVKQDSRQWDGKVQVINFWATWCPPCLREIPTFIELQKTHGDKGLQFIGIAIDTQEKVEAFMKKMDINYPVLISTTGGTTLAHQYGNSRGALPFTAVVDREGNVIFTQAGELTHKKAEEHILPLL